ncbi:hypothetical protein [Pseudomonas synxantha]|uniref:Uncharacterized protein n=1 Tax=Pseudomonas synxantha TaxID=47883 RepID=A0ACC6JRE4_9PSED|nr:hypothetical protein [Pseudomonas synxantha]MDR6609049.1 hypothetical protein [Pseudomonas synxantha]
MKQPESHSTTKAQTILWATLIILAIITIGLLSIQAANNTTEMSQWLRAQASALLIWRLVLYCTTGYGWYRMRIRLTKQGFSPRQHQRLLFAEIVAVAAIALLELQTLRSN